jgi:enoyl-CoA hydratase
MELSNLEYRVEEGIATIVVNRPDVLNALNSETFYELDRAFAAAEDADEVKAVILTGAGKAFVAGADIQEMSDFSPLQAQAFSELGQAVMNRIEGLSKPVVAAVNGFALGGGCELAMACHIRIASEKARFGQPEVKLGLLPGFAGTQRLPRLVGRGRALEILLTGEPIKAQEAHRIGLVNRVAAPDALLDEARSLCKTICSQGPVAVRSVLEAVREGLEMPQGQGNRFEAKLFGVVFSSEDMREGIKAFLEKRKPEFKGR